MKVFELIKVLETMPQGAEVYLKDVCNSEYWPMSEVWEGSVSGTTENEEPDAVVLE